MSPLPCWPTCCTCARPLDKDLDEITTAEADEDTRGWLADTALDGHRRAMSDPDQEHTAFLHNEHLAGFAVMAGLDNPHQSVELIRLVVHPGGWRGHGHDTVRLVVDRAFSRGA